MLQERHSYEGGFKLQFHRENEVIIDATDVQTLIEIGCEGKTPKQALVDENGNITYDDNDLPSYQVDYDFSPLKLTDPLLLY